MIKSIKVMLLPNNKQNTKLFRYAGSARFAYNWAIAKERDNDEYGGKFISDYDLRKEFTKLKQQEEFEWLNSVSNNVTKQAIKDACGAYKKFFKNQSQFPKFKSKRKSRPGFYQDNVKIKFSDTHVKLEGLAKNKMKSHQKINWIKLAEKSRIPTEAKYCNPRITFDGLHWWISIGIECENSISTPQNDGIGIDLGIKDLAVCSDGTIYKSINKTKKVKNTEKQRRRLQRRISRKYLKNKSEGKYCKTSNILKSEKKLLKITKRLTNIRKNYIHQTTSEIINRKPNFIVMEDLNVSGMVKNRHLSKAIQNQSFYEFKRQIIYKSDWNNILFIEADRYYPSSKRCSECGYVNSSLKLSDRTFICPECGNEIDRDNQAALNLQRYGNISLRQVV